MDNDTKLCIIIIIILSLFTIGLIVYSTSVRTSLIDPKNCGHVTGDFGLRPQSSGTTLNTCGETSTEACSFSDILNLAMAVNKCNTFEFCEAFVYNQNSHIMSIINPLDAIAEDQEYDLYSRQTPILVT